MNRFIFNKAILLSAMLAVQSLAAFPVTETDGEMEKIKSRLTKVETRQKKTEEEVKRLGEVVEQQDLTIRAQKEEIEEVRERQEGADAMLNQVKEEMMRERRTVESGFRMSMLLGMAGLLIAIAMTIGVYHLLRKRMENDDRDIRSVLDRIAANSGENHSLVLSIVNEMVRIEQNLTYMDEKTRGVSQLKNRVARISSALLANGYEVPKLINTEYREGMNYDVVMEEDESIAPHEQRIKRVMQPCVIYNGIMIQTAKVVVAYNPCEDD